jgi:hypothetical protein
VFVTHRVSLRNARVRVRRRETIEARVGALLPERVKAAIKARRVTVVPEHEQRLRHHYAYWREKWGWDLVNPDMAEIRRRYEGSELLWSANPEMRAAGEEIAERAEGAARHRQPRLRPSASCGRFGFLPPPHWTTMTSYEPILEVIQDEGLADLDGDFLEIGVFLGGGVHQLARIAPQRRVIACDVFSIAEDDTPAATGVEMSSLYAYVLGDGDQRELFDAVTAGLGNVEVVVGDSAHVELPTERLALAHIDGNHSAEYVRSDFEKVWPLVVDGGVVAFDDYGHDLPVVTETVDALCAEHAAEIDRFWTAGQKTAFVRKVR